MNKSRAHIPEVIAEELQSQPANHLPSPNQAPPPQLNAVSDVLKKLGGLPLLTKLTDLTNDSPLRIEQTTATTLAELVCQSRVLSRLPMPSKWSPKLTQEWRHVLLEWSKHAQYQMHLFENTQQQSIKDQIIHDLCLSYQALPAKALLPLTNIRPFDKDVKLELPDSAPTINIPLSQQREADILPPPILQSQPPPNSSSPSSSQSPSIQQSNSKHKRVAKLFHQGYTRKAIKTLISNGVATPSEHIADTLQQMHPQAIDKSPFEPLPANIKQQAINPGIQTIAKHLKTTARHMQTGADPFGWRPSLFFPVRNIPHSSTSPAPIQTVARLLHIITTQETHPAVHMIMNTGILTALNKIPEEENKTRIQNGQTPKIRPVNSGSFMERIPSTILTKDPAVLKFSKSLQNSGQYGLKPDGATQAAYKTQQAYNNNKAIQIDDQTGAFTNFPRTATDKILQQHCPQLVQYFRTLYSKRSPSFYIYKKNGQTFIRCIWSASGVKQGNPLASLLYNATAEYTFLIQLRKDYPNIELFSLTDDAIKIWKDTPTTADREEWISFYHQYEAFVKSIEELQNPFGFTRAPEKSFLLVPRYAPLPLELGIQSITSNIKRDGITIAGAPIGSTEFQKSFLRTKMDQVLAQTEAIIPFGQFFPQEAFRILKLSTNHLLDYVARILPPSTLAEFIMEYDDIIFSAALDLLYPGQLLPTIPASRREIACILMNLSHKHGGFQLPPLAWRSPALFLSAVHNISSLPGSTLQMQDQQENLQSALDLLHTSFDKLSMGNLSSLTAIIPRQAIQFTSSDFRNQYSSKARPLSKLIVSTIETAHHLNLLTIANELQKRYPEIPNTQATLMQQHIHNISLRSKAITILEAPLDDHHARPPRDSFCSYFRFYCMLPQEYPQLPSVSSPSSDIPLHCCPASSCQMNEHALLDPFGNHAIRCPDTWRLATNHTHNLLRDTIAATCKEAGFTTTTEPATHKLLLHRFTPAMIRNIFPKTTSAALKKQHQHIKTHLLTLSNPSATPIQKEVAKTAIQAIITALSTFPPSPHAKGLRVDLAVEDSFFPYWIDFSVIHPTAQTYFEANSKWFQSLSQQTLNAALTQNGSHRPMAHGEVSPAITNAARNKIKKYDPLLQLAEFQRHRDFRHDHPAFFACIVSHQGELSSHFFRLFKWFQRKYFRDISSRYDYTGVSGKERARAFYNQLMHRTISSLVHGWGSHLQHIAQSGLAI